jgi:hypothetical protein
MTQCRGEHAPNMAMVMQRVHMEHLSRRNHAWNPLSPFPFIISRGYPNAHELTNLANHILHPSQAPCLRSPGALRKTFAQVVWMPLWNSPCVADGDIRKFSPDTF